MRIVPLSSVSQFAAVNLTLDPGYIGGKHAIPNCVEVRMNWSQEDGKLAHNVLHARYTSGFVPTVAIADAIRSGIAAAMSSLLPFLATSTGFNSVDLRDLNTIDQPYITGTFSQTLGTGAGAALPNEVAAVITLRTALIGQANRGRIYIPGFSSTALGAGNIINATAVTALGTLGTGIRSTINSQAGLFMALKHAPRAEYPAAAGGIHQARAAGTVDVTSTVVRDNHWDTNRRRGLK